MKLSSLIGAFATFTTLYAASIGAGDKPLFTMALIVQYDDADDTHGVTES